VTQQFIAMLKDDEGATLVEYGLVVSLIAVAAITAITLLGTNVNNIFGTIAGKLTTPGSGS
jgi:pilus assembly protein Flp/PilA